jgi:hypothetical protein
MINTVKGAAITQTYDSYIDSISTTYGAGLLLCGLTTYTLGGAFTGSNTWMSFAEPARSISVQTNSDGDSKFSPGYSVTIIGCLVSYPGICSPPQTFTISI